MAWGGSGAASAKRDTAATGAVATAPGAPGRPGVWSDARKTAIGTSYAPYGAGRTLSRVWFSVSRGLLTETMYGLIHQAQLRQLQFAVAGSGFLVFEEGPEIESRTEYLRTDAAGRPLALAYRIVNRDAQGRFEIEKHLFTDPDRDCLFLRVIVRAPLGGVIPYLLADPQVSATCGDDFAEASREALHAWDASTHLVIAGSEPFANASVGFIGVSDGERELRARGTLSGYETTGAEAGNVGLAAALEPVGGGGARTYDFVMGFGGSVHEALSKARASLRAGYREVLGSYGRGWAEYLQGLSELPRLAGASTDSGRLLYASALVLKAQEDKTYPGALIASLSTPWGDTVPAEVEATGYKAVWPRDFYQVASAMLALGDTATPVAALDYLRTVQVQPTTPCNGGASGWFLQKSHVDGTPEWTGVQLDQTAMPIMLADKLFRAGLISKAHLAELFATTLAPAADFLVNGGAVAILGGSEAIVPPATQMERWEEQGGHSPSTTAAEITGLLAAADLAALLGASERAARYLAAARTMRSGVVATTFTTCGVYGDGRYFLRIAPRGTPDSLTPLEPRNGKPGLAQQRYLDAGFLELVRYGILAPDAAEVRASLDKIDDQQAPHRMRIRYDFTFPGEPGVYPGWRRYSDDGYGEDMATGAGFGPVGPTGLNTPDQRGRVWPIFTGERGHYEIALAAQADGGIQPSEARRIRDVFVRGMELFANEGLMLPEQVHDGVGPDPMGTAKGCGTGAATPLAWSHAEYVKLLRSVCDGAVWDRLSPEALAAL